MKIALVGYGKMGHMIKDIAIKRGNQVVMTIDPYANDATVKATDAAEIASALKNSGADAVIEFTHPDAVLSNIRAILPLSLPLVVGTTGWMNSLKEMSTLAEQYKSSLFYAANYSIGVNLFYKVVQEAAELFSNYDEYDCAIWEAHHNTKADSPSGTALEIANRVMMEMKSKKEIISGNYQGRPQKNQLQISSTRLGCVPGVHKVFFDSNADTIEVSHTARSREGFALGAVRAAEWLANGLSNGNLVMGATYTMDDMLA